MPVRDEFARIPLAEIEIIDRQRRDIRQSDLDHLAKSISQHGVIEPIIVERLPEGENDNGSFHYRLLVGERRCRASQALGLVDIPARFAGDLSPIERKILELEENIKRSDLAWIEIVSAVSEIHRLHGLIDSGWTMGETAEVCALNLSTVSMYLSVAGSITDARIADSGTVREAYNIIRSRQERAQGDTLQELLEVPDLTPSPIPAPLITVDGELEFRAPQSPPSPVFVPEPEPIQVEDFIKWAPGYSGKKFNFIHCDFPYGVNLFSANGLRTGPSRSQMGRDEGDDYADDPDLYWRLLNALTDNLDRFMSVAGHLMFWTSADTRNIQGTLAHFALHCPSIAFHKFPLIWFKTDNAGIAAVPTMWPRHVYEVCLFGSRNNHKIAKLVSDVYGAPTDKSIHVSAKPEPMLKHFFQLAVDENTSMFDPTCGSGTALRAAEALGARRVFGLERNPEMAMRALRALKSSRSLRRASEVVK